MADPAGGSFSIRYARVTSRAAQTGTESGSVTSVTDVSTEHTNRRWATDPAPRATGRRDHVQPANHDGCSSPIPRCGDRPRASAPPMLRARPHASARIEASVILVTV